MKIKTALSIGAFAVFFVASLLLVTFITGNSFTPFTTNDINPRTQGKLYKFIRQDRQNLGIMLNKIQNRNPGDHLAFAMALKDYGESTANLDTSDLPEDFQVAWKKYSTAKCEWADFVFHWKSRPSEGALNKTEMEMANEKLDAEGRTWHDVESTAKAHGLDIKAIAFVNLQEK